MVKLIAAVIVLTVITSVIMLIPNWDGEQASTAAPKIDHLLDVMIVLSSFVFSIVLVMLFYAIWRWRARPGDEGDGAPIHGNTRLEIAWTVIPTAIVPSERSTPGSRFRHRRPTTPTGWWWTSMASSTSGTSTTPARASPRASCTCPSTGRSSSECTASTWSTRSARVADQEGRRPRHHHPRATSRLTRPATTPGLHRLCGFGHATMRAPVNVEDSQAAFDQWSQTQQPIPKASRSQGRRHRRG